MIRRIYVYSQFLFVERHNKAFDVEGGLFLIAGILKSMASSDEGRGGSDVFRKVGLPV